jgi:hypothetical protein
MLIQKSVQFSMFFVACLEEYWNMTLYDYNLLTEKKQLDLLYENGVFIGKQKKMDQTIVLFQLDGFYVEVFYKKYRYFISKIRCFTSTDRLAPYLVQIDVEDVMKAVNHGH